MKNVVSFWEMYCRPLDGLEIRARCQATTHAISRQEVYYKNYSGSPRRLLGYQLFPRSSTIYQNIRKQNSSKLHVFSS